MHVNFTLFTYHQELLLDFFRFVKLNFYKNVASLERGGKTFQQIRTFIFLTHYGLGVKAVMGDGYFSMVDTIEKQQMRAWVETWRKAGDALEEIRRQELQNYDYNKNLPLVDEMLQWAYEHRAPRSTSGLVEQQRWFMKFQELLLEQQQENGRSI